jgi:hypothetical protein
MSSGTHRAQQEREARGFQFFWPGVPPTVQSFTLPAVTRILATKQELPFHPGSRMFPGIPPLTAPLQGSRIVSKQEQPGHPVPGSFIHGPAIPQIPGVNTSKGYII